MNVVLLRNRPHFGAQITTIPVLHFFSEHYCQKKPLVLLSKNNVSWIYSQLPWVQECIHSKHRMDDLKQLNKCDNLLNLRPNNRFLMIMYKALKGGQVFDLVANDFLIELTATQYNKMCDDEYRALNYLKIFIKEESALLPALAAPFQVLAQSSSLQVATTQLNLLLMPGGGAGEIKKWGIDNFIAAGNAIATQLNKTCHLHVLLGPDETEEINIMKALMAESNNLSLHTNIPIKDIAQLASRCNLTIANDCGPSHIAQCLQKPYIGIYREPNPEWFLNHALSRKVIPQTGQDIKTIDIESVTEHAVHLLESQY